MTDQTPSWLFFPLAADKTIKLWNSESGKLERTLNGHTQGISDVAWSSDSLYLCSASDDKTVRVWSITQVRGRKKGEKTKKLNEKWIPLCLIKVGSLEENPFIDYLPPPSPLKTKFSFPFF